MEESEIEIEIPNLPRGRVISLYILSTWGDSNYVGMNGVEFWNREGKLITPNKVCSDGSLEESIDPRSNFYNIIDGMNHTQDDIHCWLRNGSRIFQSVLSSRLCLRSEENELLYDILDTD